MKPILTIDRDDKGEIVAAYLEIRHGDVDSTAEEIPGIVMIDRDRGGSILGIELLELEIEDDS